MQTDRQIDNKNCSRYVSDFVAVFLLVLEQVLTK